MRHTKSAPQTAGLIEILAQEAAPAGRAGPGLVRGVVAEIREGGEILVRVSSDQAATIRCDFLETGQGPTPALSAGDLVLVLEPSAPGQNGCVLGRIGRYRPPAVEPTPSGPPDHVVIEAGEMLSFKCGESSVDLRKDGKLMILGNDVLTRAKRTQRIKGGTVAIN